MVNRRGLLAVAGLLGLGAAGIGGGVLVERGMLPGRNRLDRVLGRCDLPPAGAEAVPGPLVRATFESALRRQTVDYLVAYPPGALPGDRLPVCLVLHGHTGRCGDVVGALRYDRYLAGAVNGGVPPFVLAAMDGGDGYWHPHPSDDPLGALLDEFLPVLDSRGLAVDRPAVLGWSMGGYGALLCPIVRPGRFAAAAASSPAIWRSYREAHRVNAKAFGSAEEWRRYDVLGRAGELKDVRLRVDCGVRDPFAGAARALGARLADRGAVHLGEGCHDVAFWRQAATAQFRMIGEALSAGRRPAG